MKRSKLVLKLVVSILLSFFLISGANLFSKEEVSLDQQEIVLEKKIKKIKKTQQDNSNKKNKLKENDDYSREEKQKELHSVAKLPSLRDTKFVEKTEVIGKFSKTQSIIFGVLRRLTKKQKSIKLSEIISAIVPFEKAQLPKAIKKMLTGVELFTPKIDMIRRAIVAVDNAGEKVSKSTIGFTLSGKAEIYKTVVEVRLGVLEDEDGKHFFSLLFGLPNKWRLSTFNPLMKKLDFFRFEQSAIAILLSDVSYFDPDWGIINKGVNFMGTIKPIGKVFRALDAASGGRLKKQKIVLRGNITKELVGSYFTAKVPIGFPLIKPSSKLKFIKGLSLAPGYLMIGIEETAAQVIRPVISFKCGIVVQFPGQEPFEFASVMRILTDKIESYGLSEGILKNAFGIRGFNLGDLTLGLSWDYALATQLGVATAAVGGIGALIPTGLTLGGTFGFDGSKIKLLGKGTLSGTTGISDLVLIGKGTVRIRDFISFGLKQIDWTKKALKTKFDRDRVVKKIPDLKVVGAELFISPQATMIGAERVPKKFRIKADKVALVPGVYIGFDLSVSTLGFVGKAFLSELRFPIKSKKPVILLTGSRFAQKDDKGLEIEINMTYGKQKIYFDGVAEFNIFGKDRSEFHCDVTFDGARLYARRSLFGWLDADFEVKFNIDDLLDNKLDKILVRAKLTEKGVNQISNFLTESGRKFFNNIQKGLNKSKKLVKKGKIKQLKKMSRGDIQKEIDRLKAKKKKETRYCKKKYKGFWIGLRLPCLALRILPIDSSIIALKSVQEVGVEVLGELSRTPAGKNLVKVGMDIGQLFAKFGGDVSKALGIALDKTFNVDDLELEISLSDFLEGRTPKTSLKGTFFGKKVDVQDLYVDISRPSTFIEALLKLGIIKG